jgi:hypothetical protein
VLKTFAPDGMFTQPPLGQPLSGLIFEAAFAAAVFTIFNWVASIGRTDSSGAPVLASMSEVAVYQQFEFPIY